MDFGSLSTEDFIKIGQPTKVNLLSYANILDLSSVATTYALGKTKLTTLNSSGEVRVENGAWNRYDWDVHGGTKRRMLITLERFVKQLDDSRIQ